MLVSAQMYEFDAFCEVYGPGVMNLKRGLLARPGETTGQQKSGARDGELQGLGRQPPGTNSSPDRQRHRGIVAPGLGLEPRF
jgi:hypothetical protein